MTAVSFHRLAAEELRKAHQWYAARDPRVADQFQQTVDDAVSRIRDDPEAQPFALKHFRWVRVRRFPYCLVYECTEDDRVLIVAVAHTSRHPHYWRRRKS
jgi:plasmid stabilization system protein ParE